MRIESGVDGSVCEYCVCEICNKAFLESGSQGPCKKHFAAAIHGGMSNGKRTWDIDVCIVLTRHDYHRNITILAFPSPDISKMDQKPSLTGTGFYASYLLW